MVKDYVLKIMNKNLEEKKAERDSVARLIKSHNGNIMFAHIDPTLSVERDRLELDVNEIELAISIIKEKLPEEGSYANSAS
jgi:hypothetical protein